MARRFDFSASRSISALVGLMGRSRARRRGVVWLCGDMSCSLARDRGVERALRVLSGSEAVKGTFPKVGNIYRLSAFRNGGAGPIFRGSFTGRASRPESLEAPLEQHKF